MREKESVVLIVLDGWGVAPAGNTNAITGARTPNFDAIKADFGYAEICASGTCVGLKEGQMGNSEVGHLTIGAGRAIFQDLMRVDEEIKSGRLGKNTMLVSALARAKDEGKTVHFLGLLSNGGVHSHIDHLFELLRICKDKGLEKVKIHVILDGRDTPPRSGRDFVAELESLLDELGVGEIATVSGRYYAMDRDNRWDRTKLAFDAIVYGIGEKFDDGEQSILQSYKDDVSDEFVIPRVIGSYDGIKNGDYVFFFNFRPDRARQITRALVLEQKEFGSLFDRNESKRPKVKMLSMTIYDTNLESKVSSILGREQVSGTLSNVLAKNKVKQLRIAETEKYAHVTYFFNGLSEEPEKYEDRILVPSLKIGTYDKKPEMSADQITEKALENIGSKVYGFILINFANADMVGHSGNIDATRLAVEKTDECIGKIYSAWKKVEGKVTLIITADHGNAEKMFDEKTGQPHTAHTSNPVPFVVASKDWKIAIPRGYKPGLVDVAPSILKVLDLPWPKVMTGQPIVRQKKASSTD